MLEHTMKDTNSKTSNRIISHYEIEGIKNVTFGFLLFSTQFSWKNNFWTWLGRTIIKLATGSSIEHIAFVTKVPKEFVGLQYEDDYNGKASFREGFIASEATKHFNSITTDVVKRLLRPSLSDLDGKGDSSWTGNIHFQEILPEYLNEERHLATFNALLSLNNQKLWKNGSPCKYCLPRAELSAFPFARIINRLWGFGKTTPSEFCSVQGSFLASISTDREYDQLKALCTTPRHLSEDYLRRQYTKIPTHLAIFKEGKAIGINEDIICATPIYE